MWGFNQKSKADFERYRSELGLAMSTADLLHTQKHFQKEDREPTITELRMLDTYWSDHCRHTTFMSKIAKVSFDDGTKVIQETYDTYLATRDEVYGANTERPVTLMDIALMGMKELCKSGELDNLEVSNEINAASIVVHGDDEQEWLVQFKNETHNHPTEIEPFGGAIRTCTSGTLSRATRHFACLRHRASSASARSRTATPAMPAVAGRGARRARGHGRRAAVRAPRAHGVPPRGDGDARHGRAALPQPLAAASLLPLRVHDAHRPLRRTARDDARTDHRRDAYSRRLAYLPVAHGCGWSQCPGGLLQLLPARNVLHLSVDIHRALPNVPMRGVPCANDRRRRLRRVIPARRPATGVRFRFALGARERRHELGSSVHSDVVVFAVLRLRVSAG